MNAAFPPELLKPRALYEEVAELLRQRIFKRELEPGSWIDELKIAKDYGISRTPLREALKVLAAEGLVTMKVRRGAYVTEVTERDLTEVYHLLSLLESDAAAVAASTASAAQLSTLVDLHYQLEVEVFPSLTRQQLATIFNSNLSISTPTLALNSVQNSASKPVDADRFFAINERFHQALLEIANNRWRDQLVADLRKVMKLNRHHSLLKSGRIEQSLQEHRALMQALQERNGPLSQRRMQEHFANGLEAAG